MPNFVRDVEEIRRRASEKIEEGAVTPGYKGDVEKTISILNEALATEIVCVLRYQHHYFMATGVHGKSVAVACERANCVFGRRPPRSNRGGRTADLPR